MSAFVILSNIGTPASPSVKDVRAYLAQFLMDPDVIPLPWILRLALVRGLIVPRRAPFSAAKYQTIWTPQGSPLLVHSRALQAKLSEELPGVRVLLGMRYGEPSLDSALQEAKAAGATKIVLAPLFPQFAQATTGSITGYARRLAKGLGLEGALQVLPPFPTSDFFLRPQEALLRERLQPGDHVLFTFHGLPESQVKAGAGCLVAHNCCDRPTEETRLCYRAQCFATARDLARRLGLSPGAWSLSFQSRLGRAKWIGPYTDDVLKALPAKGVRKLLVASPSFVADCLETLEELGVEGQETFLHAGGERYELAPCVNGNADFAAGLAQRLREWV